MKLSTVAALLREFAIQKGTSVSAALAKVERKIQNARIRLAGANLVEKIGLQRELKTLENKRDLLTNITRVVVAVDAGCEFFGALTDSFKNQFVPLITTLIILCGSFRSVLSFVVGLCANAVIMSAVICVVAVGVKEATGEVINLKERLTRKVCQGVFIFVALGKLLYAVLPTGIFTFVVAAITVVIGICILKGEMDGDESDSKK